jgi:hypothetical protein
MKFAATLVLALAAVPFIAVAAPAPGRKLQRTSSPFICAYAWVSCSAGQLRRLREQQCRRARRARRGGARVRRLYQQPRCHTRATARRGQDLHRLQEQLS